MNNKHLSWYKEINSNFIIASRAYFLQIMQFLLWTFMKNCCMIERKTHVLFSSLYIQFPPSVMHAYLTLMPPSKSYLCTWRPGLFHNDNKENMCYFVEYSTIVIYQFEDCGKWWQNRTATEDSGRGWPWCEVGVAAWLEVSSGLLSGTWILFVLNCVITYTKWRSFYYYLNLWASLLPS